MPKRLIDKFESFSIYFIKIYLKYWLQCESLVLAPKNDVDFLKELNSFSQLPNKNFKEISDHALATQRKHLDYLSWKNAIFFLFDKRVSDEIKEKSRIKLVGKNLQSQKLIIKKYNPDVEIEPDLGSVESDQEEIEEMQNFEFNLRNIEKELEVHLTNCSDDEEEETIFDLDIAKSRSEDFENICLSDLIKEESLLTFKLLGLKLDFLKVNASQWQFEKTYLDALKRCNEIHCSSILTEQLVGLVQKLNDSNLVRDKESLDSLVRTSIQDLETNPPRTRNHCSK